jgi:hypothetical protein
VDKWTAALDQLETAEKSDVETAFEAATGAFPKAKKRGRPRKDTPTSPDIGSLGEMLGGNADSERILEFEMGKRLHEAVSQLAIVENPENKAKLSVPPTAFVEPVEKPYPQDMVDHILTNNMAAPGFLTDFINVGRGMESPTLFFAWNCLWLLSTVLTREAWLRWFPKPLYPNLYVLLVAPPSLCRKSSSMTLANDLLRELPNYMSDTLRAYQKSVRIITGKATSEGILGSLFPQERTFYGNSQMITVSKGSQAAFSISEFAVFMGKQQYNQGLVTLLTGLFDSADVDAELTRGRGDKKLKDIYVTLMGGATPDGLRLSIPEEAFGGGFMSRVILAFQDVPIKIYSMPKRFQGYPTMEDLYYPLAWIATNAKGEYYLDTEAEEYYDNWYRKWKAELFDKGMDKKEEFRFDNLLLRTAMLMRVQEYRPGTDINLWHVKVAQKLLEYTLRQSKRATEDVGAGQYLTTYNAVKRKIERSGSIARRELLPAMSSRGISATQVSEVLNQLKQEGYIKIRLGGNEIDEATSNGAELYMVNQGGNNGV